LVDQRGEPGDAAEVLRVCRRAEQLGLAIVVVQQGQLEGRALGGGCGGRIDGTGRRRGGDGQRAGDRRGQRTTEPAAYPVYA